jgi:hypothetical protein
MADEGEQLWANVKKAGVLRCARRWLRRM